MMLSELAKAYEARGDEVLWSYAPTFPERDALTINLLKEMNAKVVDLSHPVDVVFHVDPRNVPANEAPVFEVPHGINSKSGYFRPDVQYEVKYHLASSEWIASRMRPWFPDTEFIPVGIPKLDPYRPLKSDKRKILVCSTHNSDLGLWCTFKDHIATLSKSEDVTIRFHPFVEFCNPQWIEEARSFGIKIDQNRNIAHSFSEATHVVSDISSASMEALALGMPVVRMETPAGKEHLKNKVVLEAQFNDYFTPCDKGDQLSFALDAATPAPKEIQEMLLVNQGRAAQKVIEVIDERIKSLV